MSATPSKKNAEIYTISTGFPGVTALCRNLSAVVGSKHIVYQPGVDIDIPKDATVIFGAFSAAYRDLIFGLPNKKGICWTSSGGEIEASTQGIEIVQLDRILTWLDNGAIDFVAFTDPYVAEVFKRDDTFWMPCPLAPSLVEPKDVDKVNGIGLFCPAKINKNIFNNLLAVKHVQKKRDVKLYTNLRGFTKAINMLGIETEVYDWIPAMEYHKLLVSMKVNLATDWSGTYWNYQAMEAALLGVPSVVNITASSYYPLTDAFSIVSDRIMCDSLSGLMVANPDSPIEIARAIEFALDHPELSTLVREKAIESAKRANLEVEKVLSEITDNSVYLKK